MDAASQSGAASTKVTTFAAPPKDFNPQTASDKSLALHGIPRRPDPVKEPVLRAIWDRVFSKPVSFVEAQLEEDKVWRTLPHGLLRRREQGFGLAGNWAGAVVEPASLGLKEPANMVFANWVVPKINTTPQESGSQIVGFWVGLGGWNTGQVLQAGTAATLSGKSVSYWAWTEWYPAGYKVANLNVQAGDSVSFLVCAPETDHGYVTILNHRTNVAMSVGVGDPNGTTPYDGSSAEWVIEAIDTEMPNFDSVTFTEAIAATQSNLITLSHASTTNTVTGGKTLATGKILAAQNEVQVIWDAAS